MKRIFILALLCLSAGIAAAKDNIAILPFSGGMGEDGETIAELFSFSSDLSTAFNIIPRTSISRAIRNEQAFQMSAGMTDPDTIVEIGKQLGAQYVVAGNIARLGSRNLLIISILKIDDLRQIAGDIQTYARIEEIQGKLPSMARTIIAATQIDAAALTKLSVVPVILDDNIDPRVADTLAQILSINFIRGGGYAVYPRTKSLEQVEAEYKNQTSGVTSDEQMVDIGKGENPRLVLSVVARKLGTTNMFNASILDLKTGVQTIGESVNYNTLDDGITAMTELAKKLTGVSVVPANRPVPANPVPARPAPTRPGPANSAIGKNLGIGAMNLVLGLGSFTQRDWAGGLTLLGGYGLAGGLIAWELSLNHGDDLAGLPGPIGLGVAGLTAVYGFIRPWIYHKNPSVAAAADRIQIRVVSEKPGDRALHVSYTVSY
ncbi:hypothetical protein AGMMS49546_03200 [Spirochaetia bacterium]|nr:hypothetical protein AGMMS49546_03200 [Spirochaetia bacterium]